MIEQKGMVPSTGWQDISSAPKDRGEVLGFWRNSAGMPIYKVMEYIRQLNGDDGEGWTAYQVQSWGYEEYAYEQPTHWIPLPSPPTEGEQA